MTERPFLYVLKYLLFTVAMALAALLLNLLFNFCLDRVNASESGSDAVSESVRTVIIDAGHGGMDGGATGVNGVLEKDLNLDISLTLAELFKSGGVNVILTRSDDNMLLVENIKGKRKMEDLKNRLAVSVNNPKSVFVSVHMNTFPAEKYSGLQVYYSKNDASSSELAEAVQSNTKLYLQPDNERKTKPAGSGIYLLDRIKTPAVLIECGFLSNHGEAELLSSPDYRFKLACVIYCSVLEFLNKE